MEKIMSKMRYFIIKTIDFIRSGIKNLYNRLLTTMMTILLVKNKGEEYILHKKGCQQSKILYCKTNSLHCPRYLSFRTAQLTIAFKC